MTPLLSVVLLQPLEFMLNALISRDPHIQKTLAAVAGGKTIRICCTSSPAWQLCVRIGEQRVLLISAPDQHADAELSASRTALLQLLLATDPASALHNPDLSLAGDITLIQDLHRALRNLDTRWDDILSPWLGDVCTDFANKGVLHASDTVGKGLRALRLDATDYLQEESAILPSPPEAAEFTGRLEQVRLDIDRLQARVNRIRSLVTN
jgi:ubiquinone biosynthesis accessory factor UbiJ